MDHFEKAHYVPSKPKEKVKKHLKQMLFGYKRCDNDLIKSSVDNVHHLENSVSVSSFSDLNSCNSANEGNSDFESLSDLSIFTVSDLSEVNTTLKTDDRNKLSETEPKNSKSATESNKTSRENVSILSLPRLDSKSSTEHSDDEVAIISSSQSSPPLYNSGDECDTNTSFTSHIMQNYKNSSKNLQTVNYETLERSKTKKQKKCVNVSEESTEEEQHFIRIKHSDDSNSLDTSSSQFVSLVVPEMPEQNFTDILGDYKYPTMKNLPSDHQNITLCVENSEILSAESMNVDEIEIEDINDSFTIDNNKESIPDGSIVQESNADMCNFIETETMETDQSLEGEESNESNCTDAVKVYHCKDTTIIVLKHPAEIHFNGKVKVKALGGTIKVLGFTLKDKFYEIYAPNKYYAQCLQTVENDNNYYGLFGKLTSAGVSVADAEEIVITLGEHDGVICMHPLNKYEIDFVQNNFNVIDLFPKPNKNIAYCFRQAAESLKCSLYLKRPWKYFDEDPAWKAVLQCGSKKNSCGIICGGKGSGKSTFLRYYVNHLLDQGPVLVIDLDPGQCEFTVAGNLSATVVTEPLIGPNFTHLKTPDLMLNIGLINTMDNIQLYADTVAKLIRYCRSYERFQNMPWIVNTMGMCNSMGLKFITYLILHVQPSFVLQIEAKNPSKRFSCRLHAETVMKLFLDKYHKDSLFRDIPYVDSLEYTFFVTNNNDDTQRNKVRLLSPRDERYLNFLAYFGQLMKIPSDFGLLGITPYEVNLKNLMIGSNVDIYDPAKVINGKIVALCEHTSDQKVFKVNEPLLCHGHGLIRGIEFETDVLYIITPIPFNKLVLVNTIVYADWVPELRGQEKHLPKNVPVPYRTATEYKERQLMFTPKRRFNPLQLLMARNT